MKKLLSLFFITLALGAASNALAASDLSLDGLFGAAKKCQLAELKAAGKPTATNYTGCCSEGGKPCDCYNNIVMCCYDNGPRVMSACQCP